MRTETVAKLLAWYRRECGIAINCGNFGCISGQRGYNPCLGARSAPHPALWQFGFVNKRGWDLPPPVLTRGRKAAPANTTPGRSRTCNPRSAIPDALSIELRARSGVARRACTGNSALPGRVLLVKLGPPCGLHDGLKPTRRELPALGGFFHGVSPSVAT